MTRETDPTLYDSGKERLEGDRYWTVPWVTKALLHVMGDRIRDAGGTIWEPAAGRGDIVKVLEAEMFDVAASDIDTSTLSGPCRRQDFFGEIFIEFNPSAIITNPPFGGNVVYEGGSMKMSEAFVRRALAFESVPIVAMLLRSEFKQGINRADLFSKSPFCMEIILSPRPQWDWWMPEDQQGDQGARHNYSWFVWDREREYERPVYVRRREVE